MNGKRTAIVLGAGASSCYQNGKTTFPTQYNILERLVTPIIGGNAVAPTFCNDTGMKHSLNLSHFLREKYNLPKSITQTDYFPKLQKDGFSLEKLYDEIETEILAAEKAGYKLRCLLEDFEAIIRSSVTSPNEPRGPDRVCQYHRMLCEALEPGDYIINFNWDSLMADALLHHSHFWFPCSGFGLSSLFPLLHQAQKALKISSLVQLYQIHGSVCLYEWQHETDKFGQPTTLFTGPNSHSPINNLIELMKVSKGEDGVDQINREVSEEEKRKNSLGYIYFQNEWFKPIFIPPSRYKKEYSNWYSLLMRRNIHSCLPDTKRILIAGYSFPPADVDHLSDIFVRKIIPSKVELIVIDPSNQKKEYQEKVNCVFPNVENIDYSYQDFKKYCEYLPTSKFLKEKAEIKQEQ